MSSIFLFQFSILHFKLRFLKNLRHAISVHRVVSSKENLVSGYNDLNKMAILWSPHRHFNLNFIEFEFKRDLIQYNRVKPRDFYSKVTLI